MRDSQAPLVGEHILEGRIDALEQDLKSIQAAVTRLRAIRWDKLQFDESVWARLDAAMGQAVEACMREVEDLRRDVRRQPAELVGGNTGSAAEQSVWQRYTDLAKQSNGVFREYHEIVGGMVYRDRGLDERMCFVADELVRNCAIDSSGVMWQSMTVLAQREALDKTFASLVRLRFPESQIWTLPLVVHEFGHVLLRESSVTQLREFFGSTLTTRFKNDAALKRLKGGNRRSPRERSHLEADRRQQIADELYVLLADAYATFTLGYAYACAAILLRFNPGQIDSPRPGYPSDDARAHVVFRVMDWLDARETDLHPYRQPVDMLKTAWSGFVARVESPLDGTTDHHELDPLIDETLDMFRRFFRAPARYPFNGDNEGWVVALKWASDWRKTIDARARLSPPELSNELRLRDVLNAAWLARTSVSGATVETQRDLAFVALATCEAVLVKIQELRQSDLAQRTRQAPPQPDAPPI